MSTKPQELNKIIADLRQIIVGKVAMPTDQIEQITLFLFLKQLSRKHDDLVRIGSKELIFTGLWERYHFDVLMRHSGEELVKECREAIESLYKNPNIDTTVRKVFERSYLRILEPKVLSHFLTFLNDKFSDGLDLGDFYESLLPILGTQNELGQFRTPRHIIDFIVKVIDPSIGEKIADPACGTAGFLVASYNYLKAKYTDDKGRSKLNPEQTKKLYNETIFGWDMEPLMVKFSLANLYLHGLKVPNVSENDTLLNENLWQHSFDIIVANPPFITPTGGARRHSRFAITSNKTEVLFCEWMVHHLNFNGRMGIIVPEGIIFDTSKGHQEIRKLFLDNGLWCVVSMPSGVFNPYSGVKTSIIFLDKTLKPENILFYKIKNIGFSLNTNPYPISENDLPEAVINIKKYLLLLQNNKQANVEESNYFTVPKEKILENKNTDLTLGRFKEIKIVSTSEWPLVQMGDIANFLRGPFGSSIKKSVCVPKGKDTYKVYAQGNVIQNDFAKGNYYVTKEKFKELEKFELKSGDIVVTCAGTLGRTAIVPNNIEKGIINSVLMRIKTDDKKVLKDYFLLLLNSPQIQDSIGDKAQGVAVKNMFATSELKKFKIPLPPIAEQLKIVSSFKIQAENILKLKKEIGVIEQKMKDKILLIWES